MVFWSHYLAIYLQAIGARFAEGLGEVDTQQLEDEVDMAKSWPETLTCLVRRVAMVKLGDLLRDYHL